MARSISIYQRQAELEAVKRVLSRGSWMRPGQIASAANLKTAVVLSALRELEADRREYLTPRLHHGTDRTRKTSRLVVEYRLTDKAIDLSLYPAFLLCPSKEQQWQHESS